MALPLIMALFGALWGLVFRSHPDPFLVWVGLSPLVVLVLDSGVSARRAFLLGWLHGAVAWLVSVSWMYRFLVTYGGLPVVVGVLLVLVLGLYLGSYHAFFAGFGNALARRLARSASAKASVFSAQLSMVILALPALWVVLEIVRQYMFSGFPWNLAAYGAVSVPGALEATAFIGSWGLSWCVVAVNGALAFLWLAWRLEALDSVRRVQTAVLGVVTAVAALIFVTSRLDNGTRQVGESGPVRVVQPNIPVRPVFNEVASQKDYQNLIAQLEPLCDQPGALLLLPESALYPYGWETFTVVRRNLLDAVSGGCWAIFNSAAWQDEEVVRNAAFAIDENGVRGRYEKLHLVPFGEYVPLGDLLPFISGLAREAGDFSPGTELALLPWGDARIGMSICFEIVFPTEVVERTRSGATILATITNDAWYGDTFAPRQHLRAAQFRAAENGRPLLRAALTGVSAVIDSRGRIAAELGVGERGVLRAPIAGREGLTPFVRLPWLVPGIAVLVLLGAIGFTAIRRPGSS